MQSESFIRDDEDGVDNAESMIEKAFEFLVDFLLGPALDRQRRNPGSQPFPELVEPAKINDAVRQLGDKRQKTSEEIRYKAGKEIKIGKNAIPVLDERGGRDHDGLFDGGLAIGALLQ